MPFLNIAVKAFDMRGGGKSILDSVIYNGKYLKNYGILTKVEPKFKGNERQRYDKG